MKEEKTVRIVVLPNARTEKIEEFCDGRLRVSVKEKPKAGAANNRVLILLARHYGVPVSFVRIQRGRERSHKTVSVKIQ